MAWPLTGVGTIVRDSIGHFPLLVIYPVHANDGKMVRIKLWQFLCH